MTPRSRFAGLHASKFSRVCAWAVSVLVLAPGAAWATWNFESGSTPVRADLVSGQDALVPGSDALFALRLRHAPHWHTYWQVPGDAGLPTRLQWNLGPGYSAGPIQWPVPERLMAGNLANYGYEGEVLLPISVHVPAAVRVGSSAHIAAHADWLVCNDLCIPGGADLSLDLPVRAAGEVHAAADAAAIDAARARVPEAARLEGAHVNAAGANLRVEFSADRAVPRTLQFFPLEGGRIVAAADQRLNVQGRRIRLDLAAITPMAADFHALRGVLVADGGPGTGGAGWAAVVDLPIARGAAAASGTPAAHAAEGTATVEAVAPPSPAITESPGEIAPPPAPAPAGDALTLVLALAGAFLGGMILNLMPCVFPVLSLKLMSLLQHREVSRSRLRAHGLAYALGAVLSFVALAAALLILRGAGAHIGWGFQLQAPLVIAALIGLFFLIGINLLGTFEFTFGAGLANSRAARALDGEGLRGSFATGILAAVVASPCTAPFMGAALGFAVTQPSAVALAVFAALGAGMAAPYLLLTMAPSLLQRLPRPGAWMERFKQFLAFPMFVTCVWLFWVLGQQVDIDGLAWTLLILVGLGLAAWSLGLSQRGATPFRWVALGAAVAAALMVVPLSESQSRGPAAPSPAASTDWESWTRDAQRAAIARGEPVFVDFTAAWCITCQANKRIVLHDARVDDAFRNHGIVRMRADWTRRDEAITQELARFSRSGVPMYVLYDRQGRPHLLPEILSIQGVLDELGTI